MPSIHAQLLNDCELIGHFPLCHLLLVNDSNYPWFILVPDRDDIGEIYQLTDAEQVQLTQESACLGRVLMQIYKGEKLNIAALGNQVPQLHLHHIVRYKNDPAWPAPIWGKVPVKPYNDMQIGEIINDLKKTNLNQSNLVFLTR